MRKLGVLAAGLAVLMTALVLGRSTTAVLAAGPTCNVPADHSSIQGAVNDLGCVTINVASGTYAENVTIGHTLTLNGAKHGVDARGRSGAGESVIDGTGNANITITADNVQSMASRFSGR